MVTRKQKQEAGLPEAEEVEEWKQAEGEFLDEGQWHFLKAEAFAYSPEKKV